jgi:hypothetical protein
MVLGEAQILEHALTAHPNVDRYRPALLAAIDRRRLEGFDATFARGDFEASAALLALIRKTPRNLKFLLKTFILRLPTKLRMQIWKLTQTV